MRGQLNNMEDLLRHGVPACPARVQGKDIFCATLYAALQVENKEVLQKLLQYKANPNCQHFNPVHTYSYLHKTYGSMVDTHTRLSQYIKPYYVLPLMAVITSNKFLSQNSDDKMILLINYGSHLEIPLGISGTSSVPLANMPRKAFMILVGSGLLAGPGLENVLCGFVNDTFVRDGTDHLHFVLENLVLSGEI